MFSWKKKYFEYLTQNNKIKTASFKVIKKITKCIQKTKHTSKQGLKHEKWVWNFNLCSLKSNYSFFQWFRRLCLFMEKGNKHIPIPKFFFFVFVFDIEKNCGVTWGENSVMQSSDKFENKLGTKLFLQYICPDADKISDNFMEVLLDGESGCWPGDSVAATSPGRANNDQTKLEPI